MVAGKKTHKTLPQPKEEGIELLLSTYEATTPVHEPATFSQIHENLRPPSITDRDEPDGVVKAKVLRGKDLQRLYFVTSVCCFCDCQLFHAVRSCPQSILGLQTLLTGPAFSFVCTRCSNTV